MSLNVPSTPSSPVGYARCTRKQLNKASHPGGGKGKPGRGGGKNAAQGGGASGAPGGGAPGGGRIASGIAAGAADGGGSGYFSWVG